MKIKIESLDITYRLLKEKIEDSYEDNQINELDYNEGITSAFTYSFAQLPFPLDAISLKFKKINDKYSANSIISSFNNSVFLNLKSKLKKRLNDNNYKFVSQNSSSKDCPGFVFDDAGDCKFSIVKVDDSPYRIIGMGIFGAEPYYFPDNEDIFLSEIKTLEGMLNIFVDCILEPHSGRANIRYLKDKVLYINP